VEFYAAVTKPVSGRGSLLNPSDARRETEELLNEFAVVYPTASIVRRALLGLVNYQLSWFDALIWAHAEELGLERLISEDFQHDRLYGTVRVVNPFL
jgi:predicted nucleic acid-binding protein